MRAVVIYESLTGHTRDAGNLIAARLTGRGVETTACSVMSIDYQALSDADLVIIGSWTDGIFVVGQRPGRAHRLQAMPTLEGKRCLVYCTYALNPGKVLEKMTRIVEGRGGEVLGGMAIRRDRIAASVDEFVDRTLANLTT
jgi:menaquinone-dependent protoporphyrinogen IX oxidase